MSEYDERKVAAINGLKVEDWSCSGGECEYVVVADTPENRKVLLDAGFTEEQVNDPNCRDGSDGTLDVSYLAFQYAGAEWYEGGKSFGRRPEVSAYEPVRMAFYHGGTVEHRWLAQIKVGDEITLIAADSPRGVAEFYTEREAAAFSRQAAEEANADA